MAKYALENYTRDANGVLRSTLVDAETGNPVSKNDKSYKVISQTDYDMYKLTGKLPGGDNTDDTNKKQKVNDKPTNFQKPKSYNDRTGGERNDGRSFGGSKASASTDGESNNFGYKHKPAIVNAASFLPGMGGIAGKLLNAGWNAKNMAAVNKARKAEGLPELSTLDFAKGILTGSDGMITKPDESLSVNGKNYKSSFGGITPEGNTTLTPQEFRQRESLATVQKKALVDKTFATDKAKAKLHEELGPVGKPTVADKIKGQVAANANAKSYAELSAQGYNVRTPDEKAAIAHALAGEMSGTTLAGLVAGDPQAREEFANMVTTVENRIGKVGNLDGVLKPSQYNSLAPSVTAAGVTTHPLATTNRNFNKYGQAILGALDSYYTGDLKPTDYSYTSYYNPSLVTPSWTNDTFTKTGFHAFGVTPDWQQSAEEAYGINPDQHPGTMVSQIDAVKPMGSSFGAYSLGYYSSAAAKMAVSDAARKATQANRPATVGQVNLGASNPSQMGGTGMSSGLGKTTATANPSSGFGKTNTSPASVGHVNPGATNPSQMGGTGMGSGFGNRSTSPSSVGHVNSGATNPSQMGGTGMSSGLGNSNTNSNNNNNKNDHTNRPGSERF